MSKTKYVCGFTGHNDKLYDTEDEALLSIKKAEITDLTTYVEEILRGVVYKLEEQRREAVNRLSYMGDYMRFTYPYPESYKQIDTRSIAYYMISNPVLVITTMREVVDLMQEVEELQAKVNLTKNKEEFVEFAYSKTHNDFKFIKPGFIERIKKLLWKERK